MLTLTQRLSSTPDAATVSFTLSLTAEELTRSRYRMVLLRDRDLLQSETGDTLVQIAA